MKCVRKITVIIWFGSTRGWFWIINEYLCVINNSIELKIHNNRLKWIKIDAVNCWSLNRKEFATLFTQMQTNVGAVNLSVKKYSLRFCFDVDLWMKRNVNLSRQAKVFYHQSCAFDGFENLCQVPRPHFKRRIRILSMIIIHI